MQHTTMPTGALAEQPERLQLALTLATRLCHDMAGTVGALTAALDLAVDGEPDALSLAQDCARELAARLRLLRAAFSDGDTQESFTELAAGLPGADRLTVTVQEAPGSLDGPRRRLAANLLFVAAQALPRGGFIRLTAEPACMTLEVAGQRAAWPVGLAHSLDGPASVAEAAGQPREVGIAIAVLLAGAIGLHITVESETRLSIC